MIPRIRLPITPRHFLFDLDRRTYDPGLVVEVEPFRDAAALGYTDIWESAPFTWRARGHLIPFFARGWHVRREGELDACALLLQLTPQAGVLHGLIVSTAVEHARLDGHARFIVATPERVVVAHTGLSSRAWPVVADLLLGTLPIRGRPRRPPPLPPAPDEDLAALAALSMSR